jgi:two-component system sensor histidine kinase QseC
VVEQLLTLARLDSSASHAADFDLVALTRQVLAELAASALDKQQTLTLDADAACPMRGDAGLVGIVVRNLVDNAIRYSPQQALIRIQVAPGLEGATLRLDDSGPGMSAGDLERLGERFFRVLGSGQAGSGLGWSIVRRIAVVSGARVQVSRSGALGGLAVDVTWPNSGAQLTP